MNQFRAFFRPAAAIAIATVCLGLTPFIASAQTPAPTDPATLLASLPQAYQNQLGPAMGGVTAAKASGKPQDMANAEALYQKKLGAIVGNISNQLASTSALLAKNPTSTSLQSELAGFQYQLNTALALPR